jgi:hypothetical protein
VQKESASRAPTGKGAKQNTIDLQWKMRANYNAGLARAREKPLAQEQWRAMEKSNAPGNGNSRTSGRVRTSGCDRGKTGNDAAREPLSDGPGLLVDLRGSLGAQRPD